MIYTQWSRWFAWHPVKIDNKRVWLSTVYRKILNTYTDYDDWGRYKYGTIFDVLKDGYDKI